MRNHGYGAAKKQAAFDSLREALVSSPVLAFPDFAKPFIVRTDASISGLGAVLCQDFGGQSRPTSDCLCIQIIETIGEALQSI